QHNSKRAHTDRPSEAQCPRLDGAPLPGPRNSRPSLPASRAGTAGCRPATRLRSRYSPGSRYSSATRLASWTRRAVLKVGCQLAAGLWAGSKSRAWINTSLTFLRLGGFWCMASSVLVVYDGPVSVWEPLRRDLVGKGMSDSVAV